MPVLFFSYLWKQLIYKMAVELNTRNILFDLGGVILDINVQATLKMYYEFGFPPVLLQYPYHMRTDLFFRYETGKISTAAFRDELRNIAGVNVPDEKLDEAWNAMIVGIPVERTRLIQQLGTRFDLYMLSNTSPLHAPVYERMYLETSGRPMRGDFRKIYYSFETGYHKPDPEAWKHVIADAGIIPGETLFVDDNIHNIKASQELGFQAIHIHERTSLTNLGFGM
jgi:FMN phosphatase YigB (HAD superfamily)